MNVKRGFIHEEGSVIQPLPFFQGRKRTIQVAKHFRFLLINIDFLTLKKVNFMNDLVLTFLIRVEGAQKLQAFSLANFFDIFFKKFFICILLLGLDIYLYILFFIFLFNSSLLSFRLILFKLWNFLWICWLGVFQP